MKLSPQQLLPHLQGLGTGQSPWPVLRRPSKAWLASEPLLHYSPVNLPGGEGYAIWSEEGLVYLGYTLLSDLAGELALRRQAWPKACLQAASAKNQLVESLQAGCYEGNLILAGTEFQMDVWQALLTIAPGSLTTYGQLAQRLNRPKGARAIGQAVGANPISILVPCHRVLASNGNLGGYHWGLALKQTLLKSELGI